MTRADEIQIELFRAKTPQQRLGLALSLSAHMIGLAKRAIERSFPELDEIGRRVKFVEVHYGRNLAERVERDLRRRAEADARA